MDGRKRTQCVVLSISLFAFTLYLWSFRGTSHSTDEWLFIDQMTQGLREGFHTVPLQYIVFYALSIPIFILTQVVRTFGTYQTLTLLNAAATAITSGLIAVLLMELGYGLNTSATTALVYGVGTQALPYSGYLLREPVAAMWLVIAALLLFRYRARGGVRYAVGWVLAFGGASFTKRTTAFLAPLYLVYLVLAFQARREPKSFWRWWESLPRKGRLGIGMVAVIGAGAIAWPLAKAYLPLPQHLRGFIPDVEVLLELFFSPGWGLFLFNPVLILTIPGVWGFFRKRFGEACFLWGAAALYLLGCTRHPLWWGTWNWGPRQVNPVLPLFTLPLAETIQAWGSSRVFKVTFGILLSISTALALMQTLVAYPFYEVAFRTGITDVEFIWNWRTSPPLNHWCFLKVSDAEVAWATSDGVCWPLFVSLSLLVGLGAWLLIRTVRGRSYRWGIYARGVLLLSAVLAAFTLHISFFDEDYGGKLGFLEAARMLQKERKPGDSLIVYMWGEPPRAYLPRVAMLNYCKGLCPPYIELVKEHFIDGKPHWEERLRSLIGNARRVWVVMEGIPETTPERPVELALARWLYYAGSTWTGPTVRVARFERGGDYVLASQELKGPQGVSSYTVVSPGPVIHPSECVGVDLRWKAPLEALGGWKVSIQLLDDAGKVASQFDHPVTLLANSRPGGVITNKYALCLTGNIAPGVYKLILVVYNPEESARLRFGNGGDYLKMTDMEVR